ncbi:MAG: hypothetical protein LAO06_02060 [Acidobacteriia bacterium]|nr:hypothetical protein [Terriglobia bacterium]
MRDAGGHAVHFSPLWFLLAAVPLLQVPENTGTKLSIRHVLAGNSSEQTIYLQGDRKRMEFRNSLGRTKGPRLVAITRCDLGQMFELNLDAGEYVSAPYPPKPLTKEEIEARGLGWLEMSKSRKPTLRIESTTVDTGERKELLGHIARHVISTRKQTPLEGSSSEPQETVTDGWYIDLDLDPHVPCEPRLSGGKRVHSYLMAGNQPAEKPEFVDIGVAETGFAVQLVAISKSTYTLPDGTKKQTDSKSDTLVTQLEQGPLDPGLFEIPLGFKHVQHIERNPRVPASTSQTMDWWERFKARVASLLNR